MDKEVNKRSLFSRIEIRDPTHSQYIYVPSVPLISLHFSLSINFHSPPRFHLLLWFPLLLFASYFSRAYSQAIFGAISRSIMAISLRNGLRLGGINEFARENYSGLSSKSAGQGNEFNFRTKRIELKRQIRSTGWELIQIY